MFPSKAPVLPFKGHWNSKVFFLSCKNKNKMGGERWLLGKLILQIFSASNLAKAKQELFKLKPEKKPWNVFDAMALTIERSGLKAQKIVLAAFLKQLTIKITYRGFLSLGSFSAYWLTKVCHTVKPNLLVCLQ